MGEGIDLPGVVKTVNPFLKIKRITHQHYLCGAIVAGARFFTLPLGECEMTTHIKNMGKRPFPVDVWVVMAPLTGRIPP